MGGAGIADVSDSARGSAAGFSSCPFSYEMEAFPATPWQPAGDSERAAVLVRSWCRWWIYCTNSLLTNLLPTTLLA